MAKRQENLTPTIYEIKIKGHLDDKWTEWLYDLTITHESDGSTTLYGPLPDQTVLHSVLAKIRDMNLPLISVTQIEADSKDEANTSCSEQAKSEEGAYAD
jgi:hypothetical protein